jgi:hypothetical protein
MIQFLVRGQGAVDDRAVAHDDAPAFGPRQKFRPGAPLRNITKSAGPPSVSLP